MIWILSRLLLSCNPIASHSRFCKQLYFSGPIANEKQSVRQAQRRWSLPWFAKQWIMQFWYGWLLPRSNKHRGLHWMQMQNTWYDKWQRLRLVFFPSKFKAKAASFQFADCPAFDFLTGDGYCDDFNNVAECSYDAGDCCLPSPKNNFCVECKCHQLEQICQVDKIGDLFCNDVNNNAHCSFDGNDCCYPEIVDVTCNDCICHMDGERHPSYFG